ncbi:Ig-like domain-containing protein [Kitasatospora indigofera]|uniref:Ig-like domain-containing protein n=1 Tax=Kitasatospora indigofera TaxID=67307 RepID=UPI0036748D01
MSRQYSRPAAGPTFGGCPDEPRNARRRVFGAATAALFATGLLLGWNSPPVLAQQSPDGWSGQGRATLPSGLTVRLDFAAAPGVTVTAEPGRLADRAGGRPAGYADGLAAGAPAEAFGLAPDRLRADGAWSTLGTLQISFSRAVRNPRLHVSGLAALATGRGGSTATAARLTVTGGSPAAPVLTARTSWTGWTVAGNALAPAGPDGGSDASPDAVAEGSLELAGTFSTATLRVEQRSTARAGSSTAPAALRQAYTVTLDETVGTAPVGYTNASHLATDLLLGSAAGLGPARTDRTAAADGAGGGGPLVELDHGAARRSPFAGLTPPGPQPGRTDLRGTGPVVSYPAEASIGHYYRLSVPVAVGGAPATLAGWIDFDRNGRFDAAERVQAEAPAGATTAGLEWTVPPGASAGETWARLRLAREASQLVAPGGFADSGGVEDQRVRLTVGAARPEIGRPVEGSTVADNRPEVWGEGAVAGASVEIREGGSALCRARVDQGGGWACRPDAALAQGAHTMTPVETTTGGVVLAGDPVRFTVKSAPPAVPVLDLPEFTNDPGLLLTGTGDPGSTVSVADQAGATATATATVAELCSTLVGPTGGWSCLPVENLSDGTHRLTPSAVDAAGNRAAGRPSALVVDTVAPAAPVLTTPAAGEVLRTARPRFAGRAEGGSTVMVGTRAAAPAAERVPSCSAVAAVDGGWSCTAARDLAPGEHSLVVSATDRAGNGTTADAVTVRLAAPSASASASVTPSATPSAPAPAGVPAATPSRLSPSPSPLSPSPSPATPAASASSPAPGRASTAAAAPSGPFSSSPSPRPSAFASSPRPSAFASSPRPSSSSSSVPPSPVAAAPASPAASAPVVSPVPSATEAGTAQSLPPAPPGLLPVLVPPAGAPAVPSASAAPTALPAVSSASARPSAPPSAAPAGRPSAPSAVASPGGPGAAVAPAPSAAPTPLTPPPTSSSLSPSPVPSVSVSAASAASSAARGSARPLPPAGSSAVRLPAPGAQDAAAGEGPAGEAAEPAGALAEPGGGGAVARHRPVSTGWRAALAGALLLLASVGLITRRVFGRGAGRRRR